MIAIVYRSADCAVDAVLVVFADRFGVVRGEVAVAVVDLSVQPEHVGCRIGRRRRHLIALDQLNHFASLETQQVLLLRDVVGDRAHKVLALQPTMISL